MNSYKNHINFMNQYYLEELERNFLCLAEKNDDIDWTKNYTSKEIKKYFLKYKNTAEFWWMIWYWETIRKFQFSFNFYNRIYLFIKNACLYTSIFMFKDNMKK